MTENIVPDDTRYVPVRQQPYCCGPACLTMIMTRHGLKPLPQELLGYHLGLTVPTSQKHEFWNPRHAEKPAVPSGFGTQMQNEKEFGMQKTLDKLNIPLRFEFIGADRIPNVEDFMNRIKSIIETGGDVLVCLNHGILTGEDKNWGHFVCIDRLDGKNIRVVDTAEGAKWKVLPIARVFEAMVFHGVANYGGLLVFFKHEVPR